MIQDIIYHGIISYLASSSIGDEFHFASRLTLTGLSLPSRKLMPENSSNPNTSSFMMDGNPLLQIYTNHIRYCMLIGVAYERLSNGTGLGLVGTQPISMNTSTNEPWAWGQREHEVQMISIESKNTLPIIPI